MTRAAEDSGILLSYEKYTVEDLALKRNTRQFVEGQTR